MYIRWCVSLAVAATVLLPSSIANALPSFGSKIPNGLKVPCPPHLIGDNRGGCNSRGFCFGLGHPNCGGFQSGDRNQEGIVLSPFGEDLKTSGFVWTKELCELDSDGDGYTNGEELGDPCCVWTQDADEIMLDLVVGFVPSHPGMKEHIPPVGFTYDKSSLCGIPEEEEETESTPLTIDQFYNPGETRGFLEFRMQPYPIPVEPTTYVNFMFNIPEDAPDFFHVVFGEAIISQPDHLRHFVLNGCSSSIDPSQEGLPMKDYMGEECRDITLGSWSPGSDLFAQDSLDTGVLLGAGLGIKSILINVHYNEGVYEDAQQKTYKMATDGIRLHYTTDFRPFTSRPKRLFWVPYGPKEMAVPPNESRYFLSRTCSVNTSCIDISDEKLQTIANYVNLEDIAKSMGFSTANIATDNLSCSSIKLFCFVDGDLGEAVQQLCPETCGLCEGTLNGTENPRNPSSYRLTSIKYHAHFLGSEMYATLIRIADSTTNLTQGQQINSTVLQEPIAIDLQSRNFWDFNDQEIFPLASNKAESNPSNGTASLEMKGVEAKPGDKIEVTCVYNSTGRDEPTPFGLSTYDEMCLTDIYVTFETPKSLLSNDGLDTGMVDTLIDLKLRSFSCDNGLSDVVRQGILFSDEDGRNIWVNHPLEESDMCVFPIAEYRINDASLDTFLTGESICPEDIEKSGMEMVVESGTESEGGVIGMETVFSSVRSWLPDDASTTASMSSAPGCILNSVALVILTAGTVVAMF